MFSEGFMFFHDFVEHFGWPKASKLMPWQKDTFTKPLFLWVQMRVGTFLKKMAPKASPISYRSPFGYHFDHFLHILGSICHPRTAYGEASDVSWEESENDDQHRSHWHGGGGTPPQSLRRAGYPRGGSKVTKQML